MKGERRLIIEKNRAAEFEVNESEMPSSWLNRQYRRMATGICFVTFMGCALLAGLTIFPFLLILPMPKKNKRACSLFLVQTGFRLFMKYMCLWRVIRCFRVDGYEELRHKGPFLFIANHPTLIDVVAIYGLVERCNCIVKKALFSNPFMGPILKTADLIPNEAGPQFLANAVRCFNDGHSLLIFPEGTRSPRKGVHPFNRGAAQVAARTNIPIVPIVVQCRPLTLRKGDKWHQVPSRAIEFHLRFLAPIALPDEVLQEQDMPRKVRAINRQLEEFFHRETEAQPSS